MKRQLLLAMLICVLSSFGEEKKAFIFPPFFGRGAGPSTAIDTSRVQVYYAFCAENLRNKDTYKDYFCLEIGKKNTKFYSYFLEEAESKVREWRKAHPNANSGPRVSPQGGAQNGWSEYQYSQWFISGGKLTEYCCFPQWLTKYNSYYEEPTPVQQWEIKSDTATLCGYRCQKAVCRFRGRDFTAWFTSQIPLRYGPWKLGGLPGLILKVTEKDHLYSFECVKIEKKKKPLMKDAYKNYNKMDKEKVQKLQRGIIEDIGNFLEYKDDNTGERLHFYKPYYPLELK